MSDALTTITHFINSPPGQLLAGGVLAGIVWKFFERVEAVLTDQTKLEIAVWLVGRKKFGPKVQPWPETFSRLFDRIYGKRHLSWASVGRCCVALIVAAVVALVTFCAPHPLPDSRSTMTIHRFDGTVVDAPMLCVLALSLPLGLFLTGYVSLFETRIVLRLMRRFRTGVSTFILLTADAVFTLITGSLGAEYGVQYAFYWYSYTTPLERVIMAVPLFPILAARSLLHPVELVKGGLSIGWPSGAHSFSALLAYPTFVFSVWLWLYADSGFLLKAARRFDLGFDWFNRKFDIEKKPLQSIGLVAGALVAVVYSTAVIVGPVVR